MSSRTDQSSFGESHARPTTAPWHSAHALLLFEQASQAFNLNFQFGNAALQRLANGA